MGRLTVEAGGGRHLEVLTEGPDDGFPLVFHNGTPTAATPNPQLERPAAARHLRLVTWSRPGYAGSGRQAGRRVADVVDDTLTVLDSLGADRFVTLGASGGGPHALACAALAGERCQAAATLASVAPYDAEGLDWMAGMAQENIDEFGAAEGGEETLRAHLERERPVFAEVTGEDLVAALGGLLPPIDAAALTGEFAAVMAETARRAVSTGVNGWLDDDLAFVGPWGFEPSTIETPVAVWQGEQDRMVPFAHGQWLAEHVKSAKARLLPDEGHLSLVGQLDRVIEDLVELADTSRRSEG